MTGDLQALIAAAPAFAAEVAPRRPVRVALVGLGRMGAAHAAVLSMLPGVTLAAAVDPAPGAAKQLRGMGFRVPVLGSLDAALDAGVDAVWICTPPDSHLALARLALARAAVFVEKPLAHTLADARALAAAAAAAPHPLACGYTLAFWPTFVAADVLLRAGAVGRAQRVESLMHLSQVVGPQRGWQYERARSGGGVVANLSSHLLYLLNTSFGVPTRVRATWRQVHTAVEDELEATLEAPGCADIRFASSWCVRGYPISVTRLTVHGEHGTLAVDNDALELQLRAPRGGFAAGRTRLTAADLPQPAPFYFNGEAYALEDAHFLRWATGGPATAVDATAALAVQRVMEALYASAAGDGTPAAVPA